MNWLSLSFYSLWPAPMTLGLAAGVVWILSSSKCLDAVPIRVRIGRALRRRRDDR